MRWSMIATAVLITALLGFAFGRPQPKPTFPLLRAPLPAQAALAAPPETPPPPAAGASFLSLIEVGPAEVEPSAGPPPVAPAPAIVAPVIDRPTDDAAARQRQRRLDRICWSAIRAAIRQALDKCAKPQLARNPRLQGELRIEVTVQAQPERAFGLLRAVAVDSPNMYMPLFSGCIQSAIAAVSFPNPSYEMAMSYPYTLESEEATPEDDSADDDDDDDDAGDAAQAG